MTTALADNRPPLSDEAASNKRIFAQARAKRAARSPSTWGAPFDAPDATPAVSTWDKAGAILDAAVTTAIKKPAVTVLALGNASHSFTPNGTTVKVISRGVQNWGTRVLPVAEARELYRKLLNAGFLVW